MSFGGQLDFKVQWTKQDVVRHPISSFYQDSYSSEVCPQRQRFNKYVDGNLDSRGMFSLSSAVSELIENLILRGRPTSHITNQSEPILVQSSVDTGVM